MNELQIFNSEEFGEVRTVVLNSEPMFCLADVCKALDIKNATDVAKRLDDDERTRLNLGRQGETNFVTESGLYAVILRSDKPNAKKFRKWITGEVLPSIRKTGSYGKPMTTAEKIQLLAQGNEELSGRVEKVEDKIDSLENDMPLYGCEIDEIQKHVKRRALIFLVESRVNHTEIEASEVQCIRIFTVSLSANMVVWHHTKASSESISQMHMSLLIAIQHQCSCRNRFHARMHIMNELFPYYIARKGEIR